VLRQAELHVEELEVLAAPSTPSAFERADGDAQWGLTGGAAMLHARAAAMRAIRQHFDADGFIEVDTPALVRSPGLEVHLSALEVSGAGERRYLPTSPEYAMKRLLAAGLTRIYQLGKAFRAEEHGALHEPEFLLLEWYRAGQRFEAVMADTERLAAHIATTLTASTQVPGVHATLELAPPWERLTVAEAFRRHAGKELASLRDEEHFFRVLVEEVEPKLGHGRPTFLTHYPASLAALARLSPKDSSVAERFEAYAEGIELCNGFGELTDPIEQRARLLADQEARRELGRPVYPIDERFLHALEAGVPQSAGNALGVDRLLMLVLGKRAIADVIAFGSARA
jgi:lysyl-tRNA synthetase class 2